MGFIFILIYLGIILTVIEISAVLFIVTGLDRKIARFQVISMLTGTGFTTGESELIIDHPVRRRLGAFLILFGAFSLAVIISAISQLLADTFYTLEIGYIAGGLLVLLFILKTPAVEKKLMKNIKQELKEHYDLADLPISDVLLMDDDDEVRQISISENSALENMTFDEIIGSEDDLILLFIKRGDIHIRKKAVQTRLEPGDRLVLYGKNPVIDKKFKKA